MQIPLCPPPKMMPLSPSLHLPTQTALLAVAGQRPRMEPMTHLQVSVIMERLLMSPRQASISIQHGSVEVIKLSVARVWQARTSQERPHSILPRTRGLSGVAFVMHLSLSENL